MKVIDLWKPGAPPTISFELFPPKTEKAAANLDQAIEELALLSPDFFSVTFGAGGSTREGSHQLVTKLKQGLGFDVVAYFACFGLPPDQIAAVLDSYQDLGIESILAVRGDEPHDPDFVPHPDSLPHASDLIALIRPRYDFCIGVAGYPEGHIDATSREKDLEYLKLKLDQGAQYIISNYFYDNRFFFDFIDRCLANGINVPILPGVMPIYSVKMMEMLAGLCGATITEAVRMGIAALDEQDKQGLLDFGIAYAVDQCTGLLKAGVPGIHIYTMDRSASTVAIVERLRMEGYL